MKILLHESRMPIIALFIFLLFKVFIIWILFSFLAAPGDISIHVVILLLIFRQVYKIASYIIHFICPSILCVINRRGLFSLIHKNKYNLYWDNISEIYCDETIEKTITKDELTKRIPLLSIKWKIKIIEWMATYISIEIGAEQIHFKSEHLYIKVKDVNTYIKKQNFVRRNWLILKCFLSQKDMSKEFRIDLNQLQKKDISHLKKQLKDIKNEYLSTN